MILRPCGDLLEYSALIRWRLETTLLLSNLVDFHHGRKSKHFLGVQNEQSMPT